MDHDTRHKDTHSHNYQKHIILLIRENPIAHLNLSTDAPYHMGDAPHDRTGYLQFVLPSLEDMCRAYSWCSREPSNGHLCCMCATSPCGAWCLLLPDPQAKDPVHLLPKAPHVLVQCLTCPSVYLPCDCDRSVEKYIQFIHMYHE